MPALEIRPVVRKFPRFPMMLTRLPALLAGCLAATALSAQELPALPASGLYGELRNNHYTAHEGRFRIPIPVLAELGGKIFDTENVVSFTDEVSTHISIACFPLDMANKWEFETRGAKDFLAWFYAGHVLPNFERRFHGVATERSLFTPELKGGALLVFTLLPGGSAFQGKASVLDVADAPPPVAKRGTLLFVESGCVFILSSELAERATQRSAFRKSADEENEILRARLIELSHRLQVPAPRPPAKR
ncbi:MAG: hypothetical protein C0502_06770 [Opitutus sp.]|nr:hypothetical protein [Opitutus sp.]